LGKERLDTRDVRRKDALTAVSSLSTLDQAYAPVSLNASAVNTALGSLQRIALDMNWPSGHQRKEHAAAQAAKRGSHSANAVRGPDECEVRLYRTKVLASVTGAQV